MDRNTAVLIRSTMAAMLVTLGQLGCAAGHPATHELADRQAEPREVGALAEALRRCRYPRRCPEVCGDGVVGRSEACDDGNREGGDGCSASCELDDIASTPGDERAGYVWCGRPAPDLTCGPDQGCCAQPNPGGPACAEERTECGQNPTFQACDGPEDCPADVHCVGTRFGNACAATGYYWLCHSDADCEPSRPHCDDSGTCTTAPVCGDGYLDAGEVCDDGNTDDGDGCSASCELDDIASTPGDDRAGYVACGPLAPDLTCGPDQGCCTQVRDNEGNPVGPLCAADRSQCPLVPSFHACDGPEDCDVGVQCMATRFGNVCGTGYYRICHSDADCESSLPKCNPTGSCQS
jgi:large repetitive protein